jgi:type IV pilus assembly protein PilV
MRYEQNPNLNPFTRKACWGPSMHYQCATQSCQAGRTRQAGFSLLEVLLAMLVFAGGAGGLALLLLASVQGTAEAQDHSSAVLHASELAQLIHANPATLGHFIYATEALPACAESLPCTDAEWARSHLQQWQAALRQRLAEAEGVVCRDSSPTDGEVTDLACDGGGGAVVKVVWRQAGRERQSAVTQRFVLPLAPQ